MARPYRRSSGDRAEIGSCTAAHAVGDIVCEANLIGMCEMTNAVSGSQVLIIEGRFRIPTTGIVGGPPAQGNYLWPVAVTSGSVLVNGTTPTSNGLTMTAGTYAPVAQVMDVPSGGLCDIKLLPQARHSLA